MGWFDGTSEVGSSKHHRSHSHHKESGSRSHHHHSSGGSIFGLGDPKHNSSSRSIFGSGDGRHNSSRSSFFGFGTGRSSSYYKRSPRSGYMQSVYHKLRRLLRDLMHYMKKNPMRVFMLVIMPLITGGALTGLLARFGIRLPGGLEKLFGAKESVGVGRGRNGLQFERSRVEGPLGTLGHMAESMGGVGGAIGLAKMFI